jgi:hypothetical protein
MILHFFRSTLFPMPIITIVLLKGIKLFKSSFKYETSWSWSLVHMNCSCNWSPTYMSWSWNWSPAPYPSSPQFTSLNCHTPTCEKTGNLGDCYYCVSGCPQSKKDHAKLLIKIFLAFISISIYFLFNIYKQKIRNLFFI